MKRYFRIWWAFTRNATQQNFVSRFGASILIFGKIIRFLFFLFFLIVLGLRTKTIVSYTLSQMVFFYLTYQLVDTIPQFFLREVYRFRGYIVSGDFDFFLCKPMSPLFRSLFGGTDILDLPMVLLSIIFLIPTLFTVWNKSPENIFFYIIFIFNAFLIALSLHIIILSFGVITTEVDNAMLLYRDMTQMGRVPVDIYKEPLRGFITFIIPVGIMMSLPAKALFGLLSFQNAITAFLISFGLLLISILFWRRAIKAYASASS